jgi:hypothetical protein
VRANFGTTPFLFNVDSYMESTSESIWSNISETSIPNSHRTINDLIWGYLQHHGYTKTAAKFSTGESIGAFVEERAKIRDAIMKGDIARAGSLLESAFPGLLDKHPMVAFDLSCRTFVELVRSSTPATLSSCILYGKKLNAEFSELPLELKAGVKTYVDDLFALIAYPDPTLSPLGWILDVEGREAVAAAVNSMILGTSLCN